MKTEIVYDVAIIGGGMIGSSAAKYVAQDVENSILIGPKFEQDGVYGAWHDEGRITKKLYESPIWRELGKLHLYPSCKRREELHKKIIRLNRKCS
jgi:flavin-dependent dehydrogenase